MVATSFHLSPYPEASMTRPMKCLLTLHSPKYAMVLPTFQLKFYKHWTISENPRGTASSRAESRICHGCEKGSRNEVAKPRWGCGMDVGCRQSHLASGSNSQPSVFLQISVTLSLSEISTSVWMKHDNWAFAHSNNCVFLESMLQKGWFCQHSLKWVSCLKTTAPMSEVREICAALKYVVLIWN